MFRTWISLLLFAVSMVSGNLLGLPLDISGLLSSLRPPSPTDPRFMAFTPPGPNDLRSPCPALNALANHNFLPKSGQNITIPSLVSALSTALNVAPELTVALGGAALASSPNPSSGAFTLADLVLIEHDASMSRQDAAFGNPQPFHAGSWAQYMASFKGKMTADVPTASRAKFTRYNDSLTHNPDFKYGAREFVLSYGEVALYLQALGGPVSGSPRMEWVRMLFEQERLPWALGWRPSAVPVTLASVGGMIVRLVAAAPEGVPELGGVVVDTYKSSLIAVAGGSGVLSKLTEGLSAVLGL